MADAKMVRRVIPAGRIKRIHGIPGGYRENVAQNAAVVPTFAIHYNGRIYLAAEYEIVDAKRTRTRSNYEDPLYMPRYESPDEVAGQASSRGPRPSLAVTLAATWVETTGAVEIKVQDGYHEPIGQPEPESVAC
jgi:hypothetical protein